MRQAKIFYQGQWAGVLTQSDFGDCTYRYTNVWIQDGTRHPISLTLPKSNQEYQSDHLYPFLCNMLPEGVNKQWVFKSMRIDTDDHFGLLMTTAKYDTIGAVTLEKWTYYNDAYNNTLPGDLGRRT